MAQDKTKKRVRSNSKVKKVQTVRERTLGSTEKSTKRRVRSAVGKARKPVDAAKKLHTKEYHLPLPNNKLGRLLSKRVKIFPKFLINAFKEIKLVTWPNARQTINLTLAVFIFALIFAIFVGLLDFGFNKIFEKFIVK